MDRFAASIDLPEPKVERMALVADPRVERGGPPGFDATSWIDLNEPQFTRLTHNPVYDDPELTAFLAANGGQYRYDYVRLGCTFCPQNGERFDKAWLTVTLKPDAEPCAEPPTSWSLFPVEDHDKVEQTVGAKLGASVKIVSAEVSGSLKGDKKIYNIKAYREGKANPFWEMYSNQETVLDGALRFHLVVRSLAASPTRGEIRLEAVISNRSFMLFREKRPFDEAPTSVFHLPAL